MAGLLDWTEQDVTALGRQVHVARHRLHERTDLIGDAALAALLDRLPPQVVHVYTMGTDPADRSPWRQGTAQGVSGAALLDAVAEGRLWLNLLRVQDHDAGWRAVHDALVAELQERVPGLDIVDSRATLLVSSPTAQVYYHADPQPNLLWHLRGRKRVLAWPALDPRFVSVSHLEKIFAAEADEELPYELSFDAAATVVELTPGDVVSWPQNSGHRVENIDGLNVSLSLEYATPATLRRQHVWAANRYFSAQWHLPLRSTREDGAWAAGKAYAFRAMRKLGVRPGGSVDHTPTFRVTPGAPLGVGPLTPAQGRRPGQPQPQP